MRKTEINSIIIVEHMAHGLRFIRSSPKTIEVYVEVAVEPKISPGYSDIVIPTNIAPINFRILEEGQLYFAKIHADDDKAIEIFSKTGLMRIPPREWWALLRSNKGNKIFFDIYVKDAVQGWRKFRSISNTVAKDDIDGYVVYRRMKPIYNWWKGIGFFSVILQITMNTSLCTAGHSKKDV